VLNRSPGGAGALLRVIRDSFGFEVRLALELARVSRSTRFLSLALIGSPPGGEAVTRWRLAKIARRIRRVVRAHDIVAWRGRTLAVLMPDTDMSQALKAAQRLLNVATKLLAGPRGGSISVGVASTYREIEGAAESLLDAVEKAQQEAAPGTVKGSDRPGSRPRILVIDDDSVFSNALAETLSEMGWEGDPCSEPLDGLARVKDAAYSAVFVDLMMPGVSGVQIVRESIALYPRRPVVLMTGKDATSNDVLSLPFGSVMFVRKPISSADLSLALDMFRALLPGVALARR
jgi:PleD family two-component response regulator